MSIDQNNPEEIFQEELQDLHSAVKDAAHEYHLLAKNFSLVKQGS